MATKPEISAIQKTLKELIFKRGLHYEDLATHLDISLSTAKRALNGDDLSFDRVLTICDWLGLSFKELMEIVDANRVEYYFLTEEQELFLSENIPHFNFLRSLQAGLSPKEISKKFNLKKSKVDGFLKDLESLGFLDRLPNDQVYLHCKKGMDWLRDGPLRKTLMRKLLRDQVDHICDNLTGPNRFIDFGHKTLTLKSYRQMKIELDEISKKYTAISRMESSVVDEKELARFSISFLMEDWINPIWDKF